MEKVFRQIKKEIIFGSRKTLDFPAHMHDDIELVYVKNGGGVAYCDGERYTLSENSFFMVFPNQVHHYSECVEGEYILLIVKPVVLLSYTDVFEQCVPRHAVWHFDKGSDDNTVYLMELAMKEFERDGYSTVIEAYLTALFGKLFEFCKPQKKRSSHDIALQILQYCAKHYKGDITVEDVANALHISRSSVSHIFGSRFSMNFCDYINSLRLADAVKLLKTKDYSMTEISYMCGFSTIRTFNRAFLKKYGVPPSKYN